MKPRDLGLLCLVILMVQAKAASVQAVESILIIQPSIADTFVNSMYLQHKYGEEPHGYLWAIFAGNLYAEYDSFKGYGSARIYIRFNTTSIPKDANILSANMCLHMYDPPKTAQEFAAYRVLSDWDQHKLIWKIQPLVTKVPTSTTTINPTPSQAWVCWDITSDLKIWHSGQAKNYGTMIKIKRETNASDQTASFNPRETLGSEELRPKLVIKIDWYKPIVSSPSPTPSPTENPTNTPPSTSSPTATPTTSAKTPTPHPRSEYQTIPSATSLAGIITFAVLVGIVALALKKHLKQKRIISGQKI